MFSGWITTLLGFMTGFFQGVSKIIDYLRAQDYVNQGRALERADINKKESEISRKQAEIVVADRTHEEVVKKLEDGKF